MFLGGRVRENKRAKKDSKGVSGRSNFSLQECTIKLELKGLNTIVCMCVWGGGGGNTENLELKKMCIREEISLEFIVM